MMLMDSRLLTISQAAGYLSVSVGTIKKWVDKGMIPWHRMPVKPGRGRMFRFRVSDLDEFMQKHRFQQTVHMWNPDNPQLPRPIVAKLLGLTDAGTKWRLAMGKIKDRTPEEIRRNIEIAYHVQMEREIRKKVNSRIASLKNSVRRYEKLAKENKRCPHCGMVLKVALNSGDAKA